jgi:conjugal transfer/entry exclusion protein
MIHSAEFARDKDSNALINTNKQAFEEYKRAKKQLKTTNELISEINSLKNDIEEIRRLLKCIIDRTE